MKPSWASACIVIGLVGCGGDEGGGPPLPPPAAACDVAAGGGSPTTQLPTPLVALQDNGREGWLASPGIADLDGDGAREVVIAREGRVLAFRADGSSKWTAPVTGRVWASPVIGDFVGDARLEVVVAARGQIYMFDSAGAAVSGFPVTWRDEVRSLAAGDVDGDGRLEIVAVTNSPLSIGGQRDIIQVWRGDGTPQRGFPPNTGGTSGCDANCFVTGGYDQNLAVGPIDGDASWDLFSGQDNAYLSWHRGDGVAFDANALFRNRKKVLGVRFMLDYAEAQQGFGDDEATANQAHFTNTAPAIADLDGDGTSELIAVGSVQNAAQTDRLRGVALWVLRSDGSRPPGWEAPFHVSQYLAGLWDFDGTNIVGATNQVSIGELDPAVPGLDMVFAGFDGKIHLVGADQRERWTYRYTSADNVLTGGVVLADLSGDGVVEVLFATYSTAQNASALYILDATGGLQQKVALPGRGSMAVPSVGDLDGDGTLEIVVNLKDPEAGGRAAQVFTVPGSATNCVQWGTARGGLLRSGYFRKGS
ncbi:MAG: VCBS repeat-containing protein [Kofleriaceae bacterium]